MGLQGTQLFDPSLAQVSNSRTQTFEQCEEEYGKTVASLTPKFADKCPVLKLAIDMLWKVPPALPPSLNHLLQPTPLSLPPQPVSDRMLCLHPQVTYKRKL